VLILVSFRTFQVHFPSAPPATSRSTLHPKAQRMLGRRCWNDVQRHKTEREKHHEACPQARIICVPGSDVSEAYTAAASGRIGTATERHSVDLDLFVKRRRQNARHGQAAFERLHGRPFAMDQDDGVLAGDLILPREKPVLVRMA
jgi:hypothetical protein